MEEYLPLGLQGLLGELWKAHGYTKATNPEYQRTLGSAIIMLAPLAPHFCSELWALLQAVPNKTYREFQWDKSVFHQEWPQLDLNYNMKLTIQKNGEDFVEVPVALWRFRQLKQEQDAFDIACCVESVQNEILPLVAQRETTRSFTMEEDYEAVLGFHYKLTQEEIDEAKKLRREEKARKKERKASKLAAKSQQQH